MTVTDEYDPYHADTTLKNGYLAGVKAGWLTPFTKRIMAMELEYNYIFGTDFDNGKNVNLMGKGFVTLDGTIKIHAILSNLKARYPEGRVHPYVGFGVGYSYFQVGDMTARGAGGSVILPGESQGAFCWQLLAGLDFDITPNFGVGIGYKYFATKPTIGGSIEADFDYKVSVFTVGLAYTF
jgi:opacity protein-like surface antigen